MTQTNTGTNEARDYWDGKAQFFSSGEGRRRIRRMAELYGTSCFRYIEPVLPEGGDGRILEAGCGSGRWVYRLAPMGYRLELLDFSKEMIHHAKALVNRRGLAGSVTGYHVLDICDMNTLKDDSFDLVLALGTPLSLCGDPERAVAEMFRITKPGGHVVCDAMNRLRTALDMARKNDMTRFFNALDKGQFISDSGVPQFCFSAEELENLFQKQGLKPCKTAAVTPFLEFPPSSGHVDVLDDDQMYRRIEETFLAVGEDPGVLGLTSRLLIVARKNANE